eukprot:TRINITY_DN99256_c0_g1_i1.p1 TRINITY_DN99256_c0_g1~~TRINITY_DN99256_c0_g1_i1.p1  ORF type:complete len:230 (-),score=31.41 TRINITY_DN99256_c0_g1_i1:38-697(-)
MEPAESPKTRSKPRPHPLSAPEEFDGRWPFSKSPKTPKTPTTPPRYELHRKTAVRSSSAPSLSPIAGSGLLRESPGAIYDLDAAGGSRMSLGNSVKVMERRYGNMRMGSAERFPNPDPDAIPGPGNYPLGPTIGPQALKNCLSGEGRSPKLAGYAFRSGQLRVPEDCNSWIVLRSRNAELNAETFETDDRIRVQKFNGQPRGAFFKGSKRVTGTFPPTH